MEVTLFMEIVSASLYFVRTIVLTLQVVKCVSRSDLQAGLFVHSFEPE
jgi:hypothetical protein